MMEERSATLHKYNILFEEKGLYFINASGIGSIIGVGYNAEIHRYRFD